MANQERLDQARHLLVTGNPVAAQAILQVYLQDHAQDAEAWYLLAQATEDLMPDQAVAALTMALKLNPDHQEAAVLLAGLRGDAEIITYPTKPTGFPAEFKDNEEEPG